MSMAMESSAFTPLPGIMPLCAFPALAGSISVEPDGYIVASVSAHLESCELSPSLKFINLNANVDLLTYSNTTTETVNTTNTTVNATTTTATTTASIMRMSGTVLVGDGFATSASAAINLAASADERWVTWSLEHAGGWRPVTGALGDALTTPSVLASLELGPGSYLSMEAFVQYTQPIEFVPDVLAMVAHPMFPEQPGSSLNISLSRASGVELNDPVAYAVTFQGGVRVGPAAAAGRVPLLGANGSLTSDGGDAATLVVLSLYSSEFNPLADVVPGLTFPALAGTVALRGPNMTLDATATLDSFSPFGDNLVFTGLRATLHATHGAGEGALINGTVVTPPGAVTTSSFDFWLSGGLAVGGRDGFTAVATGDFADLETDSPYMRLTVNHAGGWEPLPSIVSPSFDGQLELGPGSYLDFVAVLAFPTPVSVGPVSLIGLAEPPSPGPVITTSLSRAAGGETTGEVTFGIKADSRVRVGEVSDLSVTGSLRDGGAHLALTMPQLTPLPDVLPLLVIPPATGTFVMDKTGEGRLYVRAFGNSTSVADQLTFKSFEAILDVAFASSSSSADDDRVELQLDAVAEVGGPRGFEASASGRFDSTARRLDMTIHHTGGWSPLPGETHDLLSSPAFQTSLVLGPGAYINLTAGIQYPGPVDLIPDAVSFVGHPSRGKPGVSLDAVLLRSEDSPLDGAVNWTVHMDGGLLLGTSGAVGGLPVFGMAGTLSNVADSSLRVEASGFVPLPDTLPTLTLSMEGALVMRLDGTLTVDASASVPLFAPSGGDVLVLSDLAAGVLLHTTLDDSAAVSSNSSESLQLSMSGRARIGGATGLSGSISGSVHLVEDVGLRTMQLSVRHPGGWSPLPPSFGEALQTPAFDADLALGPGSNLSLAAHVQYSDSIELFEGLTLLGFEGEPATGPALNLSLVNGGADGAEPIFGVSLSAAVRLGQADESSVPLLGLQGQISNAGDSSLVVTSASFVPLPDLFPDLRAPALVGTILLKEGGGGVTVDARALPVALSIANGDLAFTDLRFQVLTETSARDNDGTSRTAALLQMGGIVTLGGSSGFAANISGHVQVHASASSNQPETSMVLEVTHPGGWELFPGAISPTFTGQLTVGTNSSLTFNAKAVFPGATSLGPIQLVAHPALRDVMDGMSVSVSVERAAGQSNDAPLSFFVRVDGGLVLGSLPAFSFSGQIDNSGATFVTYMPQFAPLPNALPDMQLPATAGEFNITSDGSYTVALVSTSPRYTFGEDVLEFFDFEATVDVRGVVGGNASAILSIATAVRVGGSDGFLANGTGYIDTATREFELTLKHAGGWSPVSQGYLASVLATPAFSGRLALGPGSYAQLDATAQFLGDIELVPDAVSLIGHPEMGKPGISLKVHVRRDAGLSPVIASLPEAIFYEVQLDGALQLGGPDSGLPTMSLIGNVQPTGVVVEVETSAFAPIPDVDLTIPALGGVFDVDREGTLNVHLYSSSEDLQLGDVLLLSGIESTLDVNAVLGQSETADATLRFKADARVGGDGGFTADLRGAFAFDPTNGSSLEVSVSHAGGWSLLGGSMAELFHSPAFDGSLRLGEDGFLSLEAIGQFTKDIVVLPDVVAITGVPGKPGLSFYVAVERPVGGGKVRQQ